MVRRATPATVIPTPRAAAEGHPPPHPLGEREEAPGDPASLDARATRPDALGRRRRPCSGWHPGPVGRAARCRAEGHRRPHQTGWAHLWRCSHSDRPGVTSWYRHKIQSEGRAAAVSVISASSAVRRGRSARPRGGARHDRVARDEAARRGLGLLRLSASANSPSSRASTATSRRDRSPASRCGRPSPMACGGADGAGADDLGQGHPEVEELGHNVGHVGPDGRGQTLLPVCVGGDRVRPVALLGQRRATGHEKLPEPWPTSTRTPRSRASRRTGLTRISWSTRRVTGLPL